MAKQRWNTSVNYPVGSDVEYGAVMSVANWIVTTWRRLRGGSL